MGQRASCCLFALCVFVAGVLPLHAALTVSIEENSVKAEGLTPGAGAVFFSVGHEPHLAYFSIRRVARFVADADRDGTVTLSDVSVPWKSIWFIVDGVTGTYTVAMPAGFEGSMAAERRTVAKKDTKGDWSELVHERPWLELLAVGRDGAVRELTAMRGGLADLTKNSRGDFSTPVELFRGVTPDAKTVKHLSKGDVLIAIDPEELEYFVVEVN